MNPIRIIATALTFAFAAVRALHASAQDWPTKPVKVMGVYGPGNMPPALARRVYDELAKTIKTPAVKEKLSGQGIDVSGAAGSELDAFVRKEISRWAKVIKDNNIKSGD